MLCAGRSAFGLGAGSFLFSRPSVYGVCALSSVSKHGIVLSSMSRSFASCETVVADQGLLDAFSEVRTRLIREYGASPKLVGEFGDSYPPGSLDEISCAHDELKRYLKILEAREDKYSVKLVERILGISYECDELSRS